MRKEAKFLLLMVLGAAYLQGSAVAQTSAHGQWFVDPKGTATSAFVYDPPPAGFDPFTASDAELRSYGFPLRSSPSDGTRYEVWRKIVSAKWVKPHLTFSTTSYGPARAAKMTDLTASSSVNSENWSGYVLTASNGTFAKNDTYIYSE
jgi:hypothetical protein